MTASYAVSGIGPADIFKRAGGELYTFPRVWIFSARAGDVYILSPCLLVRIKSRAALKPHYIECKFAGTSDFSDIKTKNSKKLKRHAH